MTNEHQLLACCVQSRESFERLSLVLESTDTLSSFGLAAWEEIKTYYATDTAATSVDLGIVKQRLIKDEPKKNKRRYCMKLQSKNLPLILLAIISYPSSLLLLVLALGEEYQDNLKFVFLLGLMWVSLLLLLIKLLVLLKPASK